MFMAPSSLTSTQLKCLQAKAAETKTPHQILSGQAVYCTRRPQYIHKMFQVRVSEAGAVTELCWKLFRFMQQGLFPVIHPDKKQDLKSNYTCQTVFFF